MGEEQVKENKLHHLNLSDVPVEKNLMKLTTIIKVFEYKNKTFLSECLSFNFFILPSSSNEDRSL